MGGEGWERPKEANTEMSLFILGTLVCYWCLEYQGWSLEGAHIPAGIEQTHIRNFCSASVDAVGSLAYCSLKVYTPVNEYEPLR